MVPRLNGWNATSDKILIEKPFLLGRYQKPVYTGVDWDASTKFISHSIENNQHVFVVEQGTPFYLKLKLSANPPPTSCEIYANGIPLPPAVPGQRAIYYSNDSVNIQSVQASDAADYKITCSNSLGEGQFLFRLKVVGKVLFLSVSAHLE